MPPPRPGRGRDTPPRRSGGTGWSSNLSVGDLDRATARARELGAEVRADPFDLPGAGRTAVLQDPAGAVVSLWQAGGHTGAGLVNEVGAWNWNDVVSHGPHPSIRRHQAGFRPASGRT